MNSKLKLVWFNGMNIDKIHFEQQERYFENLIHTKSTRCLSNCHGLFELEISQDLLNLGKIALTKISGIAQDGSIFDAPSNDILPEPLEIAHNIASSVITLKIQLHSDSVPDVSLQNAFPHSKYITTDAPTISKIHDDMSVDSQTQSEMRNTHFSQEKVSLVLGSLRLKLGILGDKTPNEIEIPIAKIKNIHSNRKIELDEQFIPTMLDVGSHPLIKAFLEEMLFSTKQHKEVLTQIFKGIDQTKNTLDFSTYLTLNLLKKYSLIFSYLTQKSSLHPESLYEKLVGFQADLLALSNDISMEQFIPYTHDDLTSVFVPLCNHIRILFANVNAPKYAIAHIVDNGNGFYDCMFDNASMLASGDIFLAIKSSLPTSALLENFISQSKIHRQDKIKSIVASQLKGLNIEPILSIPSVLPHLSGYAYFRLDKNDPIFATFANQRTISIYLTNNIAEPDIKLWSILS